MTCQLFLLAILPLSYLLTTIVCTDRCLIPDDLKAVQDDINAVSGWSAENHLRLNRNKTKYMIISR